jgi:hypothetical protein
MKKLMLIALVVSLCILPVGATQAGIVGVSAVQVDNSGGGAPLANYVTNDILISFTGQYTGSQILLDTGVLGGLYQDANGGTLPPNGGFFGFVPSLEFDTILAQGSTVQGGAFGEPSVGGGAVDLGGAAGAVFDSQQINQATNPSGGTIILDQNDFVVARISIRNDVSQPVFFLASAAGEISQLQGAVTNGVLAFVPEPSTLILGGFGLMSILGVRRRS